MLGNHMKSWRRARDSNPQGPRGPVDFKSTALPVEASPPGLQYRIVIGQRVDVPRASSPSPVQVARRRVARQPHAGGPGQMRVALWPAPFLPLPSSVLSVRTLRARRRRLPRPSVSSPPSPTPSSTSPKRSSPPRAPSKASANRSRSSSPNSRARRSCSPTVIPKRRASKILERVLEHMMDAVHWYSASASRP
jgi:hypothetical protein